MGFNKIVGVVALFNLAACAGPLARQTTETKTRPGTVSTFDDSRDSVEFSLKIPTEGFFSLLQSGDEGGASSIPSNEGDAAPLPPNWPDMPDQNPAAPNRILVGCADGPQVPIVGKMHVVMTEYDHTGGASQYAESFSISCSSIQLLLNQLSAQLQYQVEVHLWNDLGELQYTGNSQRFTLADRRIELIMQRPDLGSVLVDLIFPPTTPDAAMITCVFSDPRMKNICYYQNLENPDVFGKCLAEAGQRECSFEVQDFGMFDVHNGCQGALVVVRPGDHSVLKFESCGGYLYPTAE